MRGRNHSAMDRFSQAVLLALSHCRLLLTRLGQIKVA